MENMMFKFLDHLNPNMFILETKFGLIPRYSRGGNYVVGDERREQILLLCDFFSCEFDYGLSIYEKWLSGKPIYVRVKNSTSDVFVPKSYS